MHLQEWTSMCDLVLIGDLIQSSAVRDLDSQGQQLMESLQSFECTVSQALKHSWLDVSAEPS